MNKKGQFFILAAVIISAVIISLVVVRNSANVGEAPRKFYYYSQELNKETGAVVDYGLFNSVNNLSDFVHDGVNSIQRNYPDMDVYACYTSGEPGTLTCENYDNESITLLVGGSTTTLLGCTSWVSSQIMIGYAGETVNQYVCDSTNDWKKEINVPAGTTELTIETSSGNYKIDLSTTLETNKYYFLFKKSAGERIDVA